MGISKVTRNFQITLPKDVRIMADIKIGDEIIILSQDKRIELIKKTSDIISRTSGLWKDFKQTGEEYQRTIRKQWEKRRNAVD